MSAVRTDIEDAVITALAALKQDQVGGYFTAIVKYNGDPSPDEEDPALNRLLENGTPVAGVMTGDAEYDSDKFALMHRIGIHGTTIEILVVSGNPRTHEAHLHGDDIDSDPGLYQMAEDIRDKLWGTVLNVSGVGVPDPVREQIVMRGERFTAMLLTYSVPIHVEAPDWDATADEYETIRQNVNNAEDDTIDPVVQGDITL